MKRFCAVAVTMHQIRTEQGGLRSLLKSGPGPITTRPWLAMGMTLALASLASALPAMAAEDKRPETHPGGHPAAHAEARHDVRRDEHSGHRDGHSEHREVHEHYAFHEHDVRHFNEHDRALWQGGAWHHEYHNGRLGYWWFAGGSWYFYDTPVYPYPVVVSDTVYVDPAVVAAPPP